MPTSKSAEDPNYDPRFDELCRALRRRRPDLVVVQPIKCQGEDTASHLGGTRDPEIIFEGLLWEGSDLSAQTVFLIDDLITSGAHFKACKKMVLEHMSGSQVVGLFWARAVNP